MGERDRMPPAASAQPSKCLLWVSTGCDVPLELLDGLRRREVAVRQVHDAPSVMSTLAVEGAKVLVLVEPAMLREIERLVHAVRSYFDVSIWRYQRGAMPALGPWMPAKSEVESRKAEVQNTPSDLPLPTSPLTNSDQSQMEAGNSGGDEDDSGTLLSEAELAMLLHNEDDDLKEADGS